MYGESSTAPVRPPPGPPDSPPGNGEPGPGCSPQQALASLPASSKITASRPPSRKAGEPAIRGTHSARKVLTRARPPGVPSAHEASCPSLHRSGVMKARFGVEESVARSAASRPSGTTSCAQAGESTIEWK
jgi:hypothetical protein